MAGSVYLLGSGFSRAISEHMLTMDGLSAAIRNDLAESELPPLPGQESPLADNFEQWLSYLIEEPPWLAEGQKCRNRGAFSDVAGSLYSVLSALQARATEGASPDWLSQLVRHWQDAGTTVITFNYDLLVEKALIAEVPGTRWTEMYPVPIAPLGIRISGVHGGRRNSGGLRLLKLHGSLGWWYSGPASPPGDQLYGTRVDRWGPADSAPPIVGVDELSVDKVPMIVPPAAVKSPYYVNNTIRALWRQAAEALSQADELVIIGFSLPPSDLIVSSMLATELNPNATIVPVDYSDAVVSNLKRIFPAERIVTEYAGLGDSAVSKWVETRANVAD
ncbi:hypothetical protein H4696_004726 [Amycolatopsis lexingtonensis]|uniref:SIR2-like domain-containing protein n=1 Tax=Amycolatopsis lexingtonensis TaxID=218822 RepID=A0ABR9I354_9PSEU|nr:hypothetical protein [Amycolatopsis lexingtonensis]MBE1497626.1 hypothetical protein [Amycolatopsis lexingtonensis]